MPASAVVLLERFRQGSNQRLPSCWLLSCLLACLLRCWLAGWLDRPRPQVQPGDRPLGSALVRSGPRPAAAPDELATALVQQGYPGLRSALRTCVILDQHNTIKLIFLLAQTIDLDPCARLVCRPLLRQSYGWVSRHRQSGWRDLGRGCDCCRDGKSHEPAFDCRFPGTDVTATSSTSVRLDGAVGHGHQPCA